MKKLFSVLFVFAFCFPMARGQTTVTFPPGKLASEQYVKNYVDSVLKLAPVVVVTPPVVILPPDRTPDPILKPCEDGPQVREVFGITEQGLQFGFHGKNVKGLDVEIWQNGQLKRSGKIKPESSRVSFGYATLPSGNYTLRVRGNTCAGESTPQDFTIGKSSSEVPANPGRTLPSKFTYVGRTDTTYLDIVLQETDNGYLITDRAKFDLRAGHDYWYTINSVIVKSAAPLTSYLFGSKTGVLNIVKHHFVKGLDIPARWPMGRSDNTWYNPNASYVFSPRSDVGGQSIILLNTDDAPTGDLVWLDITPDWYQGDHTMSWPYRSPVGSVSSGKMLGYNATLAGTTSQQRLSRGETHSSDNSLPMHQRLGRVVGCRVLGINTTTGDRDYYRGIADRMQLDGAAAYETNEGEIWLPHASPQVRQIMERLSERYQESGQNYFLNADYGGYSFVTKPIDGNNFRWKYRASPEELRQKDDYFRAFGSSINTINVKNYGPDPIGYGEGFYNRLSQFEIIKRAGYKAIGFTWNFMELFQQGYAPGFAWENKIEGNAVLTSSLAVFPYEDAVLDGFISMWYGDGLWVWDGQGTRNRNPLSMGFSWDVKKTTLNGFRVREDRNQFEGSYQPEPDAALDGFFVGSVTLSSQCKDTEGGERKYVPFTVNGVRYGVEADGSDVLTANGEKRAICQARVKGNRATVFFTDPYAKLEWRDLAVEIAGKTYTGKVFGKRPFVANVTL